MTSPINGSRAFWIWCLSAVLLLLAGCAAKIRHYPSPAKPAAAASKSTPAKPKAAPGTQRPYEVFGEVYYPLPSAEDFVEEGFASWYGPNFHCKSTACGEIYNMYDLTAAHRVLPMHTYLRVLNLENGLETVVRVNDRGPFVKWRVVDLSLAAAKALGVYLNGTAYVRIEALGTPTEVTENGQKVKRFVHTADYKLGDFWIQVGAFTDKNNADRLKNSLQRDYEKVEIDPYNRDDKLFYRVQIFAATNLDRAKAMERDLSGRFPDAFVVAK